MKADGIGKSPYSLSVSGENELKDDVARRVLARDVLQVSGENELKVSTESSCGEPYLFISVSGENELKEVLPSVGLKHVLVYQARMS